MLKHTGISRLFALEYRLSVGPPFAAANPFPAAIIDAIAGYRYLIEDIGFDANNIIIGGDSAGGTIAIALTRYLALHSFQNLKMPRGLLLLSPYVDWGCTHSSPNSSIKRNLRSDYIHTLMVCGYPYQALQGELPDNEIAISPWLSPASLKIQNPRGLFKGFPKTCIVAGEAELALDPMRTLKERMVQDIGEEHVNYMEVKDATHDFLTQIWHEPERTETLDLIAKWFEMIVSAIV